ncbi:MAG: DEAD/DEAH box helicase [Alphaproteobacteria bacterium]
MNLSKLIADPRTSLREDSRRSIKRDYDRDIRALSDFVFWSDRNRHRLWEHQKTAIATVIAYLNGDKRLLERPECTEAALLKLPTGTGKSGIIAVLSRCLPTVSKILVLTPREELTKQLLRDIRYRFWGHLGFEVVEKELFVAGSEITGKPLTTAYIQTLLPSHTADILTHVPDQERAILVGTHQALQQIRKAAIKESGEHARICAAVLDYIKNSFDLVIVDEGHYEPAVSWSRGVREFNRPTVLLSATPYRNDYKSFRVRGRYVFNYSYEDAIAAKVIRPYEVIRPAAASRIDDDAIHAEADKAAIGRFIKQLRKELPPLLTKAARWFGGEQPKVMVRGEHLETLIALQTAIDKAFKTQSVLIHDRAEKTTENRCRFTSVSAAVKACAGHQFWIHQLKLMEGIDDSAFVVVAIYDLMRNARQLVQQVGRVTRYKHVNGKGERQVGWIIAPPSSAEKIHGSLERYRAYEKYAARNTDIIVSNEVTLPDRLLELMPSHQYVAGQFRQRFDLGAGLNIADVRIPRTAAIFEPDAPITDIREFANEIEEDILDKDRFKITPIANLPDHAIAFSYYAWRNSPLLVDRFFSEWRLGVFIAVSTPPFVFMHDTEGLVIDAAAMKMSRAQRQVLEKAFRATDDTSQTRLSRLSFTSLEMSRNAIRGLAIRTRAFEEIFTDLLDPSLVPSTAFGFIDNRARYVGFVGARLRDASDGNVLLSDYLSWTQKIRDELIDPDRTRSSVFERYAQVVDDLEPEEASVRSILIDFPEGGFIDRQEDEATVTGRLTEEEPDYDDRCADVDPVTGDFQIILKGRVVPCKIIYRPEVRKYRLQSEALNGLYPPRELDDGRHAPSMTQRLNLSQSFRLIVAASGVVYADGKFYRPELRWKIGNGSKPILNHMHTAACLAAVVSEKGEELYERRRTDWRNQSIFGLFEQACTPTFDAGPAADPLLTAIADIPVWLCDDDNREIADFIGIDEERERLIFVHAKAANSPPAARGSGFNVTSLQEVGRQAQASLAFIGRGTPSPIWTADRWRSVVHANTVPLRGRDRVFKNREGHDTAALTGILANAIANLAFEKEIWIVAANMVRRQGLDDGLDATQPSNRLRQFLMHWHSLQNACARANVTLHLYCN